MFEVRQLGGSWDACARNDHFNDPWGGGRTNTIVRFVALGVVDQKVIELNSSTGGARSREIHTADRKELQLMVD